MKINSKATLTIIEAIIAGILFSLTLYLSKETLEVTFPVMVGLILYFMIYLELIRAIIDYILSDEHKFKVRYIYDMGIIFLIREILVSLTTNHHHIKEEFLFLFISTILTITLFVLRIQDARSFKYLDKCSKCKFDFSENEEKVIIKNNGD